MRNVLVLALAASSVIGSATAQTSDTDRIKKAADELPLRSIGPGLMSGRIADIAVHPRDALVRGGRLGRGLEDDQRRHHLDADLRRPAVVLDRGDHLDPTTPEVVWVGTGENVSGRHVGWGDGVYRSRDGGRTWQSMGLAQSEHIGRILVDPRDSNVVLVAAEGPLWAAGGERGVYRSTDGGATWTPVLQIDEHTGVTDLEFDPANPDVVYAAAYQRRRHVWGFLGGGPGSGIWKSDDNGRPGAS